jgi:PAS domain S-box-containing protein
MMHVAPATAEPAAGIRGPGRFAGGNVHFGVAEKVYAIVALFVLLTVVLVLVAIRSVGLQNDFRRDLAASSTAAVNIERVNGLIYAIVMESRGVYMSTEPDKVKQYGDELLNRSRDLAGVVAEWQKTVRPEDATQFKAFKERIVQFIDFRAELVRRAYEISPAAGRAWGDNDENRALRSKLNSDLEAIGAVYVRRAASVAEIGEQTRHASWILAALGGCTLLLAALNVVIMRRFVITPLADITEATDWIAAGKIELGIPHIARRDEIGKLAHAVQKFREAASRNVELQLLESDTANERDAAAEERDKLNDKYYATKWQLSAAINNMPQGMVMLNAAAEVLVVNEQYRKMYGLPAAIKAGSSLSDILHHRVRNGLFTGNVAKYLAAIVARIAKREPSSSEIELADGRIVHISEHPMAGGGWVATHHDFTEQRRMQRTLERTERLLVTVIENIPDAIVAKDERSMRYIFVNRAAEKFFGVPRADIIGRTASELFPAETARFIEEQDRLLFAADREVNVGIHALETPNNGRRLVAARRIPIDGKDGESRVFLTIIDDRTGRAEAAV